MLIDEIVIVGLIALGSIMSKCLDHPKMVFKRNTSL